MDFHAAQVEVLNEFAPLKPVKTKKLQLKADVPGVFIYHCGAKAMSEDKGGVKSLDCGSCWT